MARLLAPTARGRDTSRIEVHGWIAVGDDVDARTYPGGPTLVRGAHVLFGPDGDPFPLTRRVVAVCRCGKSQSLPLCDGRHRFVPGFSEMPVAPSPRSS
jgi:CDGSH-type Zn-finger protein